MLTYKTSRYALGDTTWRMMCGVVAGLIRSDTLVWRHNGLGCLQAYIHEGSEQEMRVHVWHSSLRKPGIEESGLYHDHRFDLRSAVLVGQINQKEIAVAPKYGGEWMLYEVLHARAAHDSNRGASYHAGPSPLPGEFAIHENTLHIHEGFVYNFPKAEFHGTYFEGDLAVTLCTKSKQEEFRARILAPRDKPLVHAFEDPLPDHMWPLPLNAAVDALMARWRGEV